VRIVQPLKRLPRHSGGARFPTRITPESVRPPTALRGAGAILRPDLADSGRQDARPGMSRGGSQPMRRLLTSPVHNHCRPHPASVRARDTIAPSRHAPSPRTTRAGLRALRGPGRESAGRPCACASPAGREPQHAVNGQETKTFPGHVPSPACGPSPGRAGIEHHYLLLRSRQRSSSPTRPSTS
jgi:hypothetical protein